MQHIASCIFVCALLASSGSLATAGQDTQREFNRDVMPILSRSGCSSGACHGAREGATSFHLSPLGSDPLADYLEIAKEGRRISTLDPASSLLLVKPSARRTNCRGLTVGSPDYRALHDWIRAGAPAPNATSPELLRLDVSPARVEIEVGQRQPLVVNAVWSDGIVQDVTQKCFFNSAHETVLEDNAVIGEAPQATNVLIRFLDQRKSVPVFVAAHDKAIDVALKETNFVDRHIFARHKQLGVQPAEPSSDLVFLRRVYLDLVGKPPMIEEIRDFGASRDPDKRRLVIDRLLASDDFSLHWARTWDEWLDVGSQLTAADDKARFLDWLRKAHNENWPLDQLARALLTAQGAINEDGAVGLYLAHQKKDDLVTVTSRVLLGARLDCARCHQHPQAAWQTDDYLGFAACFRQVEFTKEDGDTRLTLNERGELRDPRSGMVVQPHVIHTDSQPATYLRVSKPDSDPRIALADWLAAEGKLTFARSMVNRYWSELFHRGFVDPADDLRPTNFASHPELLDALAKDLIEHQYDAKHLLRTLCNSTTYQMHSEPPLPAEKSLFSRYYPRRLKTHVLAAVLQHATLSKLASNEAELRPLLGPVKRIEAPCQAHNAEIPGAALILLNSDVMAKMINDPQGRLGRIMAGSQTDEQICELLYLATVCRFPTLEEKQVVLRFVSEKEPQDESKWPDIMWALLNTREFIFNH